MTDHIHTIHIVNGPNINALGRRGDQYGNVPLEELNADLQEHANAAGLEAHFFQSNSEGDLLDYLYEIDGQSCGIILNPGAFGHTSLALADCLVALNSSVIEVHMTNLYGRPDRPVTITGKHCHGVIMGFGSLSYFMALDFLRNALGHEDEQEADETVGVVVPIKAPTIN